MFNKKDVAIVQLEDAERTDMAIQALNGTSAMGDALCLEGPSTVVFMGQCSF